MKNQTILKLFSILFLGLTIHTMFIPTVIKASTYENEPIFLVTGDDPVADAKAAAQLEDSSLWFWAGCALGATGMVIAYIIEPKPSAVSLLGKSPEYVAVYSDVYTKEVKNANTKAATRGCIASGVSVALLYAILIPIAIQQEQNSK